jgi:hypothetical protein
MNTFAAGGVGAVAQTSSTAAAGVGETLCAPARAVTA